MRLQDARDLALREGISLPAAKMRLVRADKSGKGQAIPVAGPPVDSIEKRMKYLYTMNKEILAENRAIKAKVNELALQVAQLRNAMARRSKGVMPSDDDYTDGPFSE